MVGDLRPRSPAALGGGLYYAIGPFRTPSYLYGLHQALRAPPGAERAQHYPAPPRLLQDIRGLPPQDAAPRHNSSSLPLYRRPLRLLARARRLGAAPKSGAPELGDLRCSRAPETLVAGPAPLRRELLRAPATRQQRKRPARRSTRVEQIGSGLAVDGRSAGRVRQIGSELLVDGRFAGRGASGRACGSTPRCAGARGGRRAARRRSARRASAPKGLRRLCRPPRSVPFRAATRARRGAVFPARLPGCQTSR
jgi:hypothetical protein